MTDYRWYFLDGGGYRRGCSWQRAGNTGTLIIDGGNYISGTAGLSMGIGGGPTSVLTINSGVAKITTLTMNNTTGSSTSMAADWPSNHHPYSG